MDLQAVVDWLNSWELDEKRIMLAGVVLSVLIPLGIFWLRHRHEGRQQAKRKEEEAEPEGQQKAKVMNERREQEWEHHQALRREKELGMMRERFSGKDSPTVPRPSRQVLAARKKAHTASQVRNTSRLYVKLFQDNLDSWVADASADRERNPLAKFGAYLERIQPLFTKEGLEPANQLVKLASEWQEGTLSVEDQAERKAIAEAISRKLKEQTAALNETLRPYLQN